MRASRSSLSASRCGSLSPPRLAQLALWSAVLEALFQTVAGQVVWPRVLEDWQLSLDLVSQAALIHVTVESSLSYPKSLVATTPLLSGFRACAQQESHRSQRLCSCLRGRKCEMGPTHASTALHRRVSPSCSPTSQSNAFTFLWASSCLLLLNESSAYPKRCLIPLLGNRKLRHLPKLPKRPLRRLPRHLQRGLMGDSPRLPVAPHHPRLIVQRWQRSLQLCVLGAVLCY